MGQKIRHTFWFHAGGMVLLGALLLGPDIAQSAH
ncbi:cytochrome c1, partial [Acetobacter sp. DmW_125123]